MFEAWFVVTQDNAITRLTNASEAYGITKGSEASTSDSRHDSARGVAIQESRLALGES